MAIGNNNNPNLFGTNYNSEEEEKRQALLAAQGAMMGAGGVPDANNPAFEGMSAPEIISAVNAPDYQTPVESKPPLVSLSPFSKGVLDNLLQGTAQPQFGIMGIDPTQSPYKDTIATPTPAAPTIVSPSGGAQGQGQSIQQGEPGSAQANFATRMATGEPLSQQEIQDANALAASMGTTFDPATGYSREAFQTAQDAKLNPPMTGLRPIDPRTGEAIINPETGKPFSQAEVERLKAAGMTSPLPQASVPLPQAFEAKTYNQEETLARLGGRTLNEYLNAPPVRTPGISGLKTDPQGRMIPNVGQFQEQPNVAQPPAAALSSFEQASLERQQRIGGTGSFEGDSQAMQDRLRAQGQTTGGQTKDLSFADARIRARGELAARGVKNPSASMVNDLARGMQAGEPERPGFKGNVYTVNGVTFAQTSNGGAQVISTGTETPEEATAKMKDYEFALKQIDKARKAYQAGDIDKANDILTAAEIQKDGFATNAAEYFKDSNAQGTGGGLTQQQQEANITPQAFDTMEEAEAANLGKGTKITIGGRNATV